MKKLIFFEDRVATYEGNVNATITVINADGTPLKEVESVDVTDLKTKDLDKFKAKRLSEIKKKEKTG